MAASTAALAHPAPAPASAGAAPSGTKNDAREAGAAGRDVKSTGGNRVREAAGFSDTLSAGSDSGSAIVLPEEQVAGKALPVAADPHTRRAHLHNTDEKAASPRSAASASAVLVGLQDTTSAATTVEPGVRQTASVTPEIVRNDAQALPTAQLPTVTNAATPPASLSSDSGTTGATPEETVVALMTQASSTGAGGKLTVSLHPKELGAVTVELQRGGDGTARIVVSASEPSTLRSLMTNREQLHAAMDAAAVPVAGRHLTFELSAPSVPATVQHVHAAVSDRQNDTVLQDRPGSQFNADSAGSSSSGQQGGGATSGEQRRRPQQLLADANDAESGLAIAALLGSTTSSARRAPAAGINITA